MRKYIKLILIILLSSTCLILFYVIYSSHVKSSYFPGNIFTYDESASGYANQLYALKEPSLYSEHLDNGQVYYRFLYLKSFENPLSIRIEIDYDKNIATLNYKECDGSGDYRPGKLVKDFEIKLNKEEISKFVTLYEAVAFMDQPSEQVFTDNVYIVDGHQWIVEVNQDGKYHLVERLEPNEGSFKDLCLYFIELSRVDLDENY